jgi:D-alanine-D-alanine ligase
MHVAIVHNALSDSSSPDEQDVLEQARAVHAALDRLGHEPHCLACDLNLAALQSTLNARRPELVFNLVESLAGTGRLIHCVPALVDALGLPYTGSSAEALFMTSNKILAKERLEAAGLPTPAWFGPWGSAQSAGGGTRLPERKVAGRWIVKSVWEHASIGLDAEAVMQDPTPRSLTEQLALRAPLLGNCGFVEAFIEGREFNLSLLDGPRGPEILPPAEILFEGYGSDRQRIVDYRAKWDATSYEYHHTPRQFEFTAEDRDLLARLSELALACWRLFGLRGYARVDFRVDENGAPWILEINANPCISPDAGFSAALERAGIAYPQAIHRIVDAALQSNDNRQ